MGRIAYGPVDGRRRATAFSTPAPRRQARPHGLRLGPPEDIPVAQAPDAADLRPLRHHRSAVARRLPRPRRPDRASSARSRIGPPAIVDEVSQSGLRGRGGAGFPTGIKWKTVADTAAPQKYIVCNADEGDTGTFADRMIMEGDPFLLIEGMTIAGIAVGATKGYVYIRSEYPHAIAVHGARAHRRAARRPSRRAVAGSAVRLRHRGPRRRRRLCLRRGDLAAREPRRQARRWCAPSRRCRRTRGCSAGRPWSTTCCRWRPRRSSSPKARRPIADFGIGRSRGTMPIQLAGNVQARRPVRDRLRRHARRARRRYRRRHAERPAGAGGAGRRAARRLFPARAVRHAVRLRGVYRHATA